MALQKIKNRPNRMVVNFLEEILAQAKNGEIVAIAIAGEVTNKKPFFCHVVNDRRCCIYRVLGAISVLRDMLIDHGKETSGNE